MRRKIVPIIVTAHAAVAIPVLSVAAASADDQTANPQAGASIVRVERVKAPARRVVHRHFRPWRRPSGHQVQTAIHAEARRWHGEADVGTTYKRALTRKILGRDYPVPGRPGSLTAFHRLLDYNSSIDSLRRI